MSHGTGKLAWPQDRTPRVLPPQARSYPRLFGASLTEVLDGA